MGGRIFRRLCPFSWNSAAEPDESSALLPQDAEPFQGKFQYYTHGGIDGGEDNPATFQPDNPKDSFLVIPYHPDPLVAIIKYVMFILNSASFTAGLVILCIGFWGLSTKESLLSEKVGNVATDPMLAFILVGLLTCALSFAGCVGFIRENICLLKTFVVGMALVIVAQSLVAILLLCFRQQIQDSLTSTMMVAMSRYHDDADLKFILDEVQMAMECCGAKSYRDWSVNLYFNCSSPGVYSCGVPYSCCIDPLQNGTVPNSQCGLGALGTGDAAAGSFIYMGGCVPQLFLWINRRSWDIAAVGGLLIAVELAFIGSAQKVMREIELVRSLC